MQIDWLTVSAQIVNFLLLVWLLKRFLYQPVLDIMAARERSISSRMQIAAQRESDAATREHDFRDRLAALERAREEQLEHARSAAKHEHGRLMEESRHEIEDQRKKWREELRREEQELRHNLKHDFAEAVVRAARQILADLADVGLEKQIVAAFVRRLAALPDEERDKLLRPSGQLRVISAFELDQAMQERLQATVKELFKGAAMPAFSRDSGVICGIELCGNNRKVSWSVGEYLADFEQRLQERCGRATGEPMGD